MRNRRQLLIGLGIVAPTLEPEPAERSVPVDAVRPVLTRASLLLALVVATGLAACNGAPRDAGPEDHGADLRGRVEADLARRGGRRYYISLSDHLMTNYPDAVRSCLAPLHGERAAAFTLFITIDADGSLSDVTSVPATVIGVCMSQRLLLDRLPRPPFSPFHASMPMRFAD